MLDEKSNERSAEDASIPSPRPIYSTKDYADKRNLPPPPPPDMLRSNARERALKRRSSAKNSVADWAWVVIAGTLFAVVLVVSFGALALERKYRTVMGSNVINVSTSPDMLRRTLIDMGSAMERGGRVVVNYRTLHARRE